MRTVVKPHARRAGCRKLDLLDLGAGNGWLCFRVNPWCRRAVAVDIRHDDVDGLGAARSYARVLPRLFGRVVASFEALPFPGTSFDICVFNASIHYALNLEAVLAEATRLLRSGGELVILDSPFYRLEEHGHAMVADKRRSAAGQFGSDADDLMALPFIEFLTRESLTRASERLQLRWRRLRVRYPLWYEWRPVAAYLRRRRPPSRFDVWVATAP
jgi:SAM-dependent methyltransferase